MGLVGGILKIIIIPIVIFILIAIAIAICLAMRRSKKEKEKELRLHSIQYKPPVITQWGPTARTPPYSPAHIQQPAPTYASNGGYVLTIKPQ